MKRAVIVVGSHYAGKSKTIKVHFKPLVGISRNQRKFRLGQHNGAVLSQSLEERFANGHILSQTLEEKGFSDVADVLEVVAKYQYLDFLVFAARPSSEPGSLYGILKSALESVGFAVATVDVVKGQPESYYAERAQEILRHLLSGAGEGTPSREARPAVVV